MSDTFKGWKQSIFQSDHLKHLGNYTLKISVINSPDSRLSPRRAAPVPRPVPHAGTGAEPRGDTESRGDTEPRAMGGGKTPLCFSLPLGGGRSARANKREGNRRGWRRRDPFVCKEVLFPHLKKGGAGAAAAPRAPPTPPARPGRPRDTD